MNPDPNLLPVSCEWEERLKSLEVERMRPTPPRPRGWYEHVTPVQARANYMTLLAEVGMNDSDKRFIERTATYVEGTDEPTSP